MNWARLDNKYAFWYLFKALKSDEKKDNMIIIKTQT